MPSISAIPYDPSRTALYKPKLSEPQPDFNTGWDIDWICAELSRLAYYRFERDDGPRLDAGLTKAGFTKAATFIHAAAGAEAIATTMPDGTAFISCRGTQPDDLKDLVADARANPVAFDLGGRVHAGFLAAWSAIAGPIASWLGATAHQRLVLTGHSLGAAMATIAAATRPEARLVTFGSPLVGDAAFARLFAGRTVRRYVDCTDLVTSVPPRLLGYVHIAPERYIDRFGVVHDTPPPELVADDRRAARRSYALHHAWQVWRNVTVRDLADHAPINYISGVIGRRARG
jgi:pimeloyl-ACP methyl ester carboxylesterase